jgi:hypothetical protein
MKHAPGVRLGQFHFHIGRSQMSKNVAVHVYDRSIKRATGRRIANMLRGLANSYGGFSCLSGQTDARYLRGRPLRFGFSSEEKCMSFLKEAKKWFGGHIEVRRLIPRH